MPPPKKKIKRLNTIRSTRKSRAKTDAAHLWVPREVIPRDRLLHESFQRPFLDFVAPPPQPHTGANKVSRERHHWGRRRGPRRRRHHRRLYSVRNVPPRPPSSLLPHAALKPIQRAWPCRHGCRRYRHPPRHHLHPHPLSRHHHRRRRDMVSPTAVSILSPVEFGRGRWYCRRLRCRRCITRTSA